MEANFIILTNIKKGEENYYPSQMGNLKKMDFQQYSQGLSGTAPEVTF